MGTEFSAEDKAKLDAERAKLSASATAALNNAREAVLGWPIPDDPRYIGESTMVAAAAAVLAALVDDIRDAEKFAHPVCRTGSPALNTEWIRGLFIVYADDLRTTKHAMADEQCAAADRISDCLRISALRVGAYLKFITQHDGGYRMTRMMQPERKRRRAEPITDAARIELADKLAALCAHLDAPTREQLDSLIAHLRASHFDQVVARLMPFAATLRDESIGWAMTEASILLFEASPLIEAAASEQAEQPVAKAARVE